MTSKTGYDFPGPGLIKALVSTVNKNANSHLTVRVVPRELSTGECG